MNLKIRSLLIFGVASLSIVCTLSFGVPASARNNPDPLGSAFWAWSCLRPELPSQSFGSPVLAKYPEWSWITFREDGGDWRQPSEDAQIDQAICVEGNWVYSTGPSGGPASTCTTSRIWSGSYSLDYCQGGLKKRLKLAPNSCELNTVIFLESGRTQILTRYMYPGMLTVLVSTIREDMNLTKAQPRPIRCLGQTVRSAYGYTDVETVPSRVIRLTREKAVCVTNETLGDWRGKKVVPIQNNYVDPRKPWKPKCGRDWTLLR